VADAFCALLTVRRTVDIGLAEGLTVPQHLGNNQLGERSPNPWRRELGGTGPVSRVDPRRCFVAASRARSMAQGLFPVMSFAHFKLIEEFP
jgi:hypothetical protein